MEAKWTFSILLSSVQPSAATYSVDSTLQRSASLQHHAKLRIVISSFQFLASQRRQPFLTLVQADLSKPKQRRPFGTAVAESPLVCHVGLVLSILNLSEVLQLSIGWACFRCNGVGILFLRHSVLSLTVFRLLYVSVLHLLSSFCTFQP